MTDTTEAAAVRVRAAKSRISAAEAEVAEARRNLEDVLLELHEEGLSYRELGELAGFGKQYAGDLVLAARDRTTEAEEEPAGV